MTTSAAAFVDSNVLIYAFTDDRRAAAAQELLASGPVISVQCLNEFVHVARRKIGMEWQEIADALADIHGLCSTMLPIDRTTHADGLRLAERYGYSIFDALILASALRAGCDTLWSEDMQDGILIDGRLRIANPFRTEI